MARDPKTYEGKVDRLCHAIQTISKVNETNKVYGNAANVGFIKLNQHCGVDDDRLDGWYVTPDCTELRNVFFPFAIVSPFLLGTERLDAECAQCEIENWAFCCSADGGQTWTQHVCGEAQRSRIFSIWRRFQLKLLLCWSRAMIRDPDPLMPCLELHLWWLMFEWEAALVGTFHYWLLTMQVIDMYSLVNPEDTTGFGDLRKFTRPLHLVDPPAGNHADIRIVDVFPFLKFIRQDEIDARLHIFSHLLDPWNLRRFHLYILKADIIQTPIHQLQTQSAPSDAPLSPIMTEIVQAYTRGVAACTMIDAREHFHNPDAKVVNDAIDRQRYYPTPWAEERLRNALASVKRVAVAKARMLYPWREDQTQLSCTLSGYHRQVCPWHHLWHAPLVRRPRVESDDDGDDDESE